ncbi:CD276 antigen-like [Stegostoma tigrinum]|uniref:CD276 antigen-like n=1 Tax=Stegostoma tigrinum TaxID=3053191 RepID=UPI00202B896E|nr:CD276 antigen-like [Stegostoma tigrinum]XP_048414090.1 CD276 antigen-like [Stegostoma tigrinum]
MQKISQFSFLVLWGRLALSKGFKVLMPKEQVIAILNQVVMLECNFTVTEEPPLKNIVINWQLANTNQVVHSYYYGRDQLKKQNPNYFGITSLFPEEFKRGNASLRLEGVKLKHSGKYQCYVSNASGSGEGIITVVLAAFYSEPRLIIKQKSSSTSLMFESSGYPKADISWYFGDNKDASVLSNTSYWQDADGLYTVQSTMEINKIENNSTYTFVLRNAVVNQTILRTFTLKAEEYGTSMSKSASTLLLITIAGSVLIIMALAILLYNKYIKAKSIEIIVPNLP